MAVTRAYEKMMQNIKEAIVSDNLRRRVLFYFLNITLSLTSLVMSIVNYFTAEYVLLAATLIFSVVCLGNVLLLHGAHMRESVIFSMFGAESLLLLLFAGRSVFTWVAKTASARPKPRSARRKTKPSAS